jgi:murein DD-endopeptidase MepM/ murein hydrolase activator NlpD
MVAARGGNVIKRGFHAALYGNYVLIHVPEEGRSYFYAHLSRPAAVGLEDQVETGQRIGSVGDTGNARGTGCHLHFELRVKGRPIDPEPALRKWERAG